MKRVEDPRLLVGKGIYADDINVPEMAHAAVLRSPHAHARIVSIDVSKAQALPGVLCVMTGADAVQVCDPLPTWASPPVLQHAIAHDRVRHVGEAVAAVAAEDRYIAEDACDLIEVVYEPLPPVVDPEEALTSTGDAVLHPERGDTNIALERKLTFGLVEEDFAAADLVIERRFRWPRSGGQPLETVGAVASFDDGAGRFTIQCNTSMYNYCGWMIASTLRVAPHKLNIVPDARGRQLRQQDVRAQGAGAGCGAGARGGPAGQVHGRPDRQHHELRQPRLRPGLLRQARAQAGRYAAQPEDPDHRRLRRLSAVRRRPARQRALAMRRPLSHQQRRGRSRRRAHQQVPAGRLSRFRLRGGELRHRAAGGRGGGQARRRPDRAPATELHPARPVPLSDPDREHVRQRQLPSQSSKRR